MFYKAFSATLRECFPTRVLLGTITNPLTPEDHCAERDITDDGSGSIKACLCSTDYCNDAPDDVYLENEIFSSSDKSQRKTISSPSRNQITTIRSPTTTRRTTRPTFSSRSNDQFTITQRTTTGFYSSLQIHSNLLTFQFHQDLALATLKLFRTIATTFRRNVLDG